MEIFNIKIDVRCFQGLAGIRQCITVPLDRYDIRQFILGLKISPVSQNRFRIVRIVGNWFTQDQLSRAVEEILAEYVLIDRP
jgi:hypothetical protein